MHGIARVGLNRQRVRPRGGPVTADAPECCVKGCDRPQSRIGGALGLCPGHYQRMRRGVRLSKPLRRYRTAKKG